MKLKNVLGAALAASLIFSSVSAYAADTEGYTVGTPIDLSTGAAVENYTAGQLIALPIDFYSSTGAVKATGISLNYDTKYLSYSIDYNTLVSNEAATTNALECGDIKFDDADNPSMILIANNIYTMNALTKVKNYQGVMEPPKSASGKVKIGWANGSSVTLRDEPELYIFFTVTTSISADNLNYELFSVNESECNVGDTENHLAITGETDKANACDGAFKVVIDTSKIDGWLQRVTATIGTQQPVDLDAYVAEDEDGIVYSFPTRVTLSDGNTATSAEVTINGYISEDKTDEENVTEVPLATVTVDLSSAPTTYVSVAAE